MVHTFERVIVDDQYDVVIIGAGVAGLVCANYLAKAGANVLLAEKHYVPGGYCSSFRRGPYYFDAGAHYLGSCRPEGQIGRLLKDHNLVSRLQLIHCEPSEVVISKTKEVFIYGDSEKTVRELEKAFPLERTHIRDCFSYIKSQDPLKMYVDLKSITFREFLDKYFDDWEIKSILATLLGNIGLPSTAASALTAVFLFREFIFDGGYYPRGGMQVFPDLLLERFKEYGGTALLLSPAEEIKLDSSGAVSGVRIKLLGRQKVEVRARVVVANCDPFQLFNSLIKGGQRFFSETSRLETVSAFIVYLGIKGNIHDRAKYHCNIWSYKKGDIDEYYAGVMRGEIDSGQDSFLFCSLPSFHDPELLPKDLYSIQLIVAAPYRDRKEWEKIEPQMVDDVLGRFEVYLPGVRNLITIQQVAIPPTLHKFTWNYRGAMYGWASTCDQIGKDKFPEESPVDGLFMAGHWTGLPSGHSGIPTVVTSGRNVARLVIKTLGKKKVVLNPK